MQAHDKYPGDHGKHPVDHDKHPGDHDKHSGDHDKHPGECVRPSCLAEDLNNDTERMIAVASKIA